MNETEATESWFSRAKVEAEKGIQTNERVVGIAIVVASILMMLYFVLHQLRSTGFFTTSFRTLEMIMLYGNLIAWIVTGALEGVFGRRLLSRLFDVFGGIIFITISLAWLLAVFPFEFVYFADGLPDFLGFLVKWISNDIARGIMVIGIIVLAAAAVYSPIGYKFVSLKRFKRKHK